MQSYKGLLDPCKTQGARTKDPRMSFLWGPASATLRASREGAGDVVGRAISKAALAIILTFN